MQVTVDIPTKCCNNNFVGNIRFNYFKGGLATVDVEQLIERTPTGEIMVKKFTMSAREATPTR